MDLGGRSGNAALLPWVPRVDEGHGEGNDDDGEGAGDEGCDKFLRPRLVWGFLFHSSILLLPSSLSGRSAASR